MGQRLGTQSRPRKKKLGIPADGWAGDVTQGAIQVALIKLPR